MGVGNPTANGIANAARKRFEAGEIPECTQKTFGVFVIFGQPGYWTQGWSPGRVWDSYSGNYVDSPSDGRECYWKARGGEVVTLRPITEAEALKICQNNAGAYQYGQWTPEAEHVTFERGVKRAAELPWASLTATTNKGSIYSVDGYEGGYASDLASKCEMEVFLPSLEGYMWVRRLTKEELCEWVFE